MKTLHPTTATGVATFSIVAALVSSAPGAPLRYTVPAGPNNTLLGSSIVALGDLNGDGIRDFAIGDPGYSTPGPDSSTTARSGQVLIVSGINGSILHELLGAPSAGQAFGISLAALDANGDGVSDIAVGATGGNGAVWIYSGLDGALLQAITAASPGGGSLFGQALSNAGDQNGDGKDDLFAGAPGADALAGKVLVLSGTDGALIVEFTPAVPGAEFGYSLATVADQNSDGRLDVAVGSPGSSSGAGALRLMSSNGVESAGIEGAISGARLGSRVGVVDDQNADLVSDLIVGSGSGGSAYLISGTSLAVITDLSLAGAAAGLCVVPGGSVDVNFDGVTEMLVGYPGASPLPRVDVIPAPAAPEPNVYEAAAADTGLGSAIAVIPGLGFAIGEPLANGGAVYLYSTLPDSDGDGVPDVDDHCPDSILDPTVIFGDLDTGVENRVNQDGCSLADQFAHLMPASGWRNHGKFVSSSVKLVKQLLRSGEIKAGEAKALRSGAARSNIGKPVKPAKPIKPAKPAKPAKASKSKLS
jgi:hypothetical protein